MLSCGTADPCLPMPCPRRCRLWRRSTQSWLSEWDGVTPLWGMNKLLDPTAEEDGEAGDNDAGDDDGNDEGKTNTDDQD